jgi:hypothetical protein
MCTGFSTFRCARNSDLTYMSPRTRCSFGSFRCARRRRRYSGIGGSSASGLELKGFEGGTELALAKRRLKTLIFFLIMKVLRRTATQKLKVGKLSGKLRAMSKRVVHMGFAATLNNPSTRDTERLFLRVILQFSKTLPFWACKWDLDSHLQHAANPVDFPCQSG